MKIQPLPGIVYLKLEKNSAGVLNTESKKTAVEIAEVIEVGDGIKDLKSGDKVFVKSWATDIINYQDKEYIFVNPETKGILAKIYDR